MSTSTVLDDVGDRDAMDEDVEHRALDRVGVHPLAHREVSLRVEVDHEDAVALLAQRDAEVQRRRRLRDAAFLVCQGDDVRHQRAFGGGSGLGSRRWNCTKLERRLVDHGRCVVRRLVRDGLGARLEPRQEA